MSSLFDDFPRGELTRDPHKNKTPQAAWASAEAILKSDALDYDPSKFLLGRLGEKIIGIRDDRHVITVAGSRAGKGVSAIIPNLIFYQGSVLAIDPKGELASITAIRRAEALGQSVCVLDPFNVTVPEIAAYKKAFNPLAMLRPDSETIVEDAGLIADAIVIPSGHDRHWDDSALNFIEGLILHVATEPAYEGRRNLVSVRDILMNGATVEYEDKTESGMAGLYIEMCVNDMAYGAVVRACNDFFDRPDNERNSVLSAARRHTKFLDFPSLAGTLSGHDFDLSALKTAHNGMTIYLCLPASRLRTCNRWFRLFINLALEAMEREKTIPDIPVLFCLDEFAILGHMAQVEDAAGQIAGFGVKLWPVIQDLPQLKTLYKDRWQTFMGNAGVLQFFGNNDIDTLEYIQKRLGKTTIYVKRQNETTAQKRGKGETGISFNPELHDLITAEEASRFFGRDDKWQRQLIVRAGRDPMVLQRVSYYEDDFFKGKFNDV